MKKHLFILIALLTFQLGLAKESKVFLKQVELEKIYTSKVTEFLSKMYDEADYYVFADVQLISKEDDKAQDKENKEAANPQQPNNDPFGYSFIEGLGLDGGSLPTIPGSSSKGAKSQNQENKD